jgi:CBS domain-containing membrane protein
LQKYLPAIGAFVAILVNGLVTGALMGDSAAPLLVASMGASAVILFCIPNSPLAQPWPFVGGHLFSVLIGITAARWVPDLALASALAVGGAIAAMILFKCVHPPGGAAALTAVVGGPAVTDQGYWFLLVPVAINVALMLLVVQLVRIVFRRMAATDALASNPTVETDDTTPPS